MTFHNRSKGKPVPPNPFWTDMSEMGIVRRKKFLGKVKDRIVRTATPPPEPKDVPRK